MYNFQSQVDVAKDRESVWNLFWDVILLFWHVIFSFVLKCMYNSFFIFSTSSFFCVELWKIPYLYFLHIILLLCWRIFGMILSKIFHGRKDRPSCGYLWREGQTLVGILSHRKRDRLVVDLEVFTGKMDRLYFVFQLSVIWYSIKIK